MTDIDSEIRGQRSEVRGQRSEFRSWKLDSGWRGFAIRAIHISLRALCLNSLGYSVSLFCQNRKT
mgnify:CR=1 FL=1